MRYRIIGIMITGTITRDRFLDNRNEWVFAANRMRFGEVTIFFSWTFEGATWAVYSKLRCDSIIDSKATGIPIIVLYPSTKNSQFLPKK